MDLITTALGAALTMFAEPAVADGYKELKSMIVKKLGSRHVAVEALENLEKKPDSAGRLETLKEEIAVSPAAADPGILGAATNLLERVQKSGGAQVTVQQNVTGDRNIFSGTGDIHLGGPPP